MGCGAEAAGAGSPRGDLVAARRSEGAGEAHPAVDGGVHRFVRQDVVVHGPGIVKGRADGQGVGDQVFSAYL